jgi:hypothetical protein
MSCEISAMVRCRAWEAAVRGEGAEGGDGKGWVRGRSGCWGYVLVSDPVVLGLGLAAILLVD